MNQYWCISVITACNSAAFQYNSRFQYNKPDRQTKVCNILDLLAPLRFQCRIHLFRFLDFVFQCLSYFDFWPDLPDLVHYSKRKRGYSIIHRKKSYFFRYVIKLVLIYLVIGNAASAGTSAILFCISFGLLSWIWLVVRHATTNSRYWFEISAVVTWNYHGCIVRRRLKAAFGALCVGFGIGRVGCEDGAGQFFGEEHFLAAQVASQRWALIVW